MSMYGQYTKQYFGYDKDFPKESFKIKGISKYYFDSDSIKYNTVFTMKPEPTNPYDKNAIMILHNGKTIGYVPKEQIFQTMCREHINEPLLVINMHHAENNQLGIRVLPFYYCDLSKCIEVSNEK